MYRIEVIALKVAFWALGLLVLSLLGVVLINLFGNITVTNQLNYTTMKNAVDSSMNESLSPGYFSAGFCVCTDLDMKSGKWVFDDASQYELVDIIYNNSNEKCNSTKKNCKVLFGEYRLDKKVFTEVFTRRFAEMVNNNKKYRIIVQEIIEYPPKVSVRVISTDDEFSPTEKNGGGYDIVNQIDAIIETDGVIQLSDEPTKNRNKLSCSTSEPEPISTPTPRPNVQPAVRPTLTPRPTKKPVVTPRITVAPTTRPSGGNVDEGGKCRYDLSGHLIGVCQ